MSPFYEKSKRELEKFFDSFVLYCSTKGVKEISISQIVKKSGLEIQDTNMLLNYYESKEVLITNKKTIRMTDNYYYWNHKEAFIDIALNWWIAYKVSNAN